MLYKRVIPRDLFNEGNLLKCYGQLYLELEKLGLQDNLYHTHTNERFMVAQSDDDGSLTIHNVILTTRDGIVYLRRPLNSRQPYPLWMYLPDDREIQVFNDDGTFTQEMKDYLTK